MPGSQADWITGLPLVFPGRISRPAGRQHGTGNQRCTGTESKRSPMTGTANWWLKTSCQFLFPENPRKWRGILGELTKWTGRGVKWLWGGNITSLLWTEVDSRQRSFKNPEPSCHRWHWHDFLLFSHNPATVNVRMGERIITHIKNKMVYLPDGRWLITVEAVSMATSSLADAGQRASHPISFYFLPPPPPNGSRERGGWPVGTWFSNKTPNSINWGHFYPVVDMMQSTIHHNGAAVSQLELDAECRFYWCHSLCVVLVRLEVSLNSCPRCLSVTPRGMRDKSGGDVLRERGGSTRAHPSLGQIHFLAAWENLDLGIGRRPINLIQPRQRVSGPHAGVNQDDLMRKTFRPGPQSEQGGRAPAQRICDAPTSCRRRLSE